MTAYFVIASIGSAGPGADNGWEDTSPVYQNWTLFAVRSSDGYSRGTSGSFEIDATFNSQKWFRAGRSAVEAKLGDWGISLSDAAITYLNFPHSG